MLDSLKAAIAGVFTPRKSANITDQGMFFNPSPIVYQHTTGGKKGFIIFFLANNMCSSPSSTFIFFFSFLLIVHQIHPPCLLAQGQAMFPQRLEVTEVSPYFVHKLLCHTIFYTISLAKDFYR